MKRRGLALALGLAALSIATGAIAHPLAPALLALDEDANGRFAVRWKPSRAGDGTRFAAPPGCDLDSSGDAIAATLDCGAAGLAGAALAIDGLGASGGQALVRVRFADGRTLVSWLDAGAPSWTVPARPSRAALFLDSLRQGARHLAGGLDHVLFVAGLVALLGGRRLWLAVTAFTLGHSATLALASFGAVRVPAALAEVAIAGTLLWLAWELASERGRAGIGRRPALLPFAFGLVHGLGFASALAAAGVARSDLPVALAGFNLGIECGQLALVAALLGLARGASLACGAATPGALGWARLAPVYAIGTLASYWLLVRVAALAPPL